MGNKQQNKSKTFDLLIDKNLKIKLLLIIIIKLYASCIHGKTNKDWTTNNIRFQKPKILVKSLETVHQLIACFASIQPRFIPCMAYGFVNTSMSTNSEVSSKHSEA